MARLYANENFPLPVVQELRLLGHDVLTASEAGTAGKAVPDRDVLAFAVAADRVLVTLNRRHFVRLYSQSSGHKGVVVCSFDADFAALARRIHAELTENINMAGKLVRVNRPA